MPSNSLPKDSDRKSRPGGPLHADYHDEVTDEHLEKIKKIVDQDSLKDAKPTSKPAW